MRCLDCSYDTVYGLFGIEPFSKIQICKDNVYVCGITKDNNNIIKLWIKYENNYFIDIWDNIKPNTNKKNAHNFKILRRFGQPQDVGLAYIDFP